jgi:hypothetical protein
MPLHLTFGNVVLVQAQSLLRAVIKKCGLPASKNQPVLASNLRLRRRLPGALA